jgi:hypothetical protein
MGKGRKMGSQGSPRKREEQRELSKVREKRKRTLSVVKIGGVALVLLVGTAFALSAVNERLENAYDLSVVGGGVPVVVQVHDPACPYCVELRGNVESLKGEYQEDELLIRFAELGSQEGADFARRYGADRVTLLFFDAEGELRASQTGVQSPNQLRRTFTRHAAGDI